VEHDAAVALDLGIAAPALVAELQDSAVDDDSAAPARAGAKSGCIPKDELAPNEELGGSAEKFRIPPPTQAPAESVSVG
jgi:hypothetical protein